ncbi:MAG: stage V sporulation protein AA [Lachnospiraceae bacterium]|jgi:stage V sporulation protein AA|nr:stage V sporulation protein AA [Lachnospiraceae bacterium]
MGNVTVYVKCDRNVEVQSDDVTLGELGSLHCADATISAKLKALKIHRFAPGGQKRCVVSATTLIASMEKACPNISVEMIGEVDVLIEKISVSVKKGPGVWLKVVLVCMVSFFGTAFTIMAYHNDIGIEDVFKQLHRIFLGKEPDGINVLEISYSLGLAAGIFLFFNHVGKRKITKDPTPIEVAMRIYEKDVNDALIETAGRQGKEK